MIKVLGLFLALAFVCSQPAQAQTESEPSGEPGKILRQVWGGIRGHNLETLWNSQKFYQAPDVEELLDVVETPNKYGNYYGQRLRGYLVAPLSGEYRFWLSGDDHCTLWLGTDDNKFSKRKLIHFKGWTKRRQWGKSRQQASGPVLLEAGRRYYIEIQHKEGWGGDHLTLAWSCSEGQGLVNWARQPGTVASQSSTHWGASPDRAIDGDANGRWSARSITHTKNQAGSWWQVDLGEDRLIDRIELFNRNLNGWRIMRRLSNFRISVLDATGNVVAFEDCHLQGTHVWTREAWEMGGVIGRAVKIELLGPSLHGEHFLSLAEVRVWGREGSSLQYLPFQVMEGDVLESYAGSRLDLDDDELPDEWEERHGFDLNGLQNGDYAAEADSDRDGLSNLEEAVRGLNPFTGNSFPGMLSLERWNGINEYDVDDLVSFDAFYLEPDLRQSVATTSYRGLKKYSGARLRGYVTAPETGTYRFWISARNGAELWLGEDETKYGKRLLARMGSGSGTGHGIHLGWPNLWDRFACQMSEEIHLEAGQKYFLELLSQQGHGGGYHVSVAWAPPGQDRHPLPLKVIHSYARESADADDDYLPDDWESEHGLDPTDNGAIDRERQGERGDFDLDGLSNRAEYLLGTDPANPDSDGDGLTDGDEARAYGTDPTASDAPSVSPVGSVDLSSYESTGSPWTMTSEVLVPTSFRGELSWGFTVPEDGFWSIELSTRLLGNLYLHEVVEVEVQVDGQSLGKRDLVYGVKQDALLRFITPMLTAGEHELNFKINNMLARRLVSIVGIELLRPEGADLNGDGLPDWVSEQLFAVNSIQERPSSRVSPASVEGFSRSVPGVLLNGSPVNPGYDDNHWFTDLLLDPDEPTSYSVGYELGISETSSIQWQETNVFDEEALIIRKGDSLKVVARSPYGHDGQPIEVWLSSSVNWARESGASATQSTTGWGGSPSRATDGDLRGKRVTHTKNEAGAWWRVDLGEERIIDKVALFNRAYLRHRLTNFRMEIHDANGTTAASRDFHADGSHVGTKMAWVLDEVVKGNSLTITRLGPDRDGMTFLCLDEVQVFGLEPVSFANADDHHLLVFPESGDFRVRAARPDGTFATLFVKVKQAGFYPDAQDLVSNTVGKIKLPAARVDASLFFEGGESLYVDPVVSLAKNWIVLQADPRGLGLCRIIARLYPEGPILGAKSVNLIGVSDALQNDVTAAFHSNIYPGYYVVTTPLVATNLPPGGKVVVNIFRAGVTFLDGSKNLTLRSEDFVNGVFHLNFLFPMGMKGGYCHHLKIYDRNGKQIAQR